MGELGTLRLRAGGNYVIANSDDKGVYTFAVSDHVGAPVADEDRQESLRLLLEEVSELRRQLWMTINRPGT
ncbi:MAG: hypothetical protein Q7J25_10285 [Vicinamibacterales bacterium]|nr:hypothetical protein [Vicinamibacterales bacterium]